jgi:hypothetical protein
MRSLSLINDIKIYAKAMKWGKWPFLVLMILAAIIVLIAKPESNSRIGTLLGYYFQIIFAFTLLSGGIFIFYSSLVIERMASNYSDELAPILPFYSPVHVWRFFKFAMTTEDEKLHRWAKMGIFWLYCTCSIFVTVPIGAIVFIVLV